MQTEPIKLLLIEDNPADAKFIEIMLREVQSQSYSLKNTSTFKEGMDLLQIERFDVVLLDLSLPDSFGLDTVKNANIMAPQVPIIVLTGRNDEDFAVEVVIAGAQDYLVKGQIDSSLLSRSIRYAIKRKDMEVDLKRINRRIEESESRLNVIVENNISGIIVLNQDDTIKFVNPAAEKILGKSGAELLGKPFEYSYTLTEPTLVTIKPADILIEILAVDIEWEGKDSYLITLHDITELKKAEESLRIKNNELMRINKALDRFVYIISHDLKKPTANIIGLLTLYEKELVKDSEKSRLVYDKLQFSAMQLKKMIEDLLEATKREINTEQNYELIDFKKMYAEVEASMDQMVAASGAQIKTDFSRYPLIFYSYQDLKSIMANLLSNAIKYRSPERKADILLKTEKTANGPMLTVKDNGLGIDLEKSGARMFKKYQRFNDEAEGTGLGLWIIKEIVEKNGGKVEVESKVGEGTTFRILF